MAKLNPVAGWAPLAVLCAVATGQPNPAMADSCVGPPISARGEPSTFEWLAKTKARANWRSRVRATRNLGPAYSNWSLAQTREERCEATARGVVCVFTASPCQL